MTHQSAKKQKISIKTIIISTLSAAAGIQKNSNHTRDFEHGNIWHYIFTGIIFTILFVASIMGIVHLLLSS